MHSSLLEHSQTLFYIPRAEYSDTGEIAVPVCFLRLDRDQALTGLLRIGVVTGQQLRFAQVIQNLRISRVELCCALRIEYCFVPSVLSALYEPFEG